MEPEFYDYIVVGLGGIGSAALYWLARNSNKRKRMFFSQVKLTAHRQMTNWIDHYRASTIDFFMLVGNYASDNTIVRYYLKSGSIMVKSREH